MIVVDASVAIKWLWPEAGSDEARRLLDQNTALIAPALIDLEVIGAITRRHRLGDLAEHRARTTIECWDELIRDNVMRLMPMDTLRERATAIAFQMRHPLGDCYYVAAGQLHNARLITADKLLHQRCRRAFKKIELLPSRVEH